MFNVKLSLLFFLLVVLCVVSILTVVSGEERTATRQIESDLEAMPQMFRVHKELREARLREFAQRVGSSEVGALLDLISKYRSKFIEVDRYICSEETGVKCDLQHPRFSTDRARIAEEQFGESLFAPFTSAVVARLKDYRADWGASAAAKAQKAMRKLLNECFGRGSKQCDWRLVYEAMCGVGKDRTATGDDGASTCDAGVVARLTNELGWKAKGGQPELVLAFDSQGIGIAHSRDPSWSYRPQFQGLVQRLQRFVSRAGNEGITPVSYDMIEWTDGGGDYLVALVPITSPSGRFVGAIMAGESITGKMVEAEKEIFRNEVTYILGDKPLASTMEQSDYKFMLASANVSQRLKKHRVSNDDYSAVSLPYYDYASRAPQDGEEVSDESAMPTFMGGVAYGPKYQTLRVVIAASKAVRLSPFNKLQSLVPIFGLCIFVVGVILFFLLIRSYQTPYETIDAGIHEVNSGNFDYEFPYDYKDELASSMAQSLNLMVAVLLGKPLPEDESEAGSSDWGGSAQGAPRSANKPDAASGLRVENEIGADGRLDKNDPVLTEAAESYYRRLYDEYRKASQSAGDSGESVTYVRFVEKIARMERELKTRLGLEVIRFVVKTDGDRVTLTPVTVA